MQRSIDKRMRKLADELADLEAKSCFVAHSGMNKAEKQTRGRRVTQRLYMQADDCEDWLRMDGDKVPPPAKLKVEAIVKKMRKLANDMIDLEATSFLVIQNWRSPAEEEPVGQKLPERLYNHADEYEDWLRMARDT
jgi:hypothetical protein